MQRLILILALIILSFQGQSQGNLQFNQVINLTYSYNFTSTGKPTVGTVTVPTGKVWKIESTSAYMVFTNSFERPSSYLSVFFGTICIRDNYVGGYGITSTYPIWLSAGTYDVILTNSYGGNIGNHACTVSIIEFNVVP